MSDLPCISCGATEHVDRPLCPACVPPEPLTFAAWLDWSWERNREGLARWWPAGPVPHPPAGSR